MIRRVNFYGRPGCGKSTTAARLFADLKSEGHNVEHAHEFVKLWAYEKRVISAHDQFEIFEQQERIVSVPLKAGVRAVISDSPVELVTVYSKGLLEEMAYQAIINRAIRHEFDYPSLNFFLVRVGITYDSRGRFQSESQAKEFDKKVETMLQDLKLSYMSISCKCYSDIYRETVSNLK